MWQATSYTSEGYCPLEKELAKLLKDRNKMLDELREQLLRAQNRMNMQVDKHRIEVNYEVKNKVYLKVHPYKLKFLAMKLNQKLSPRL